MHTTKDMAMEDFDIWINGDKCSFDRLFPGFNELDRLGIVVRRPAGSAGASALLMAAVTRFYDFYRVQLGNESDKLRIYPEFFIFHVGKQHMDHYWMDVWTPNKEVIVEDDPEQILEAINDRGITRLLVEDIPPSRAFFLDETAISAKLRIKSALAYSPAGRVQNPNVYMTSCPEAEGYLLSSFKRSEHLFEITYEELKQQRETLKVNGLAVETYRRIDVSDALNMLTTRSDPGPTTALYFSMS